MRECVRGRSSKRGAMRWHARSGDNSDCLCRDSAAQASAFQCISNRCSESDIVAFGLSLENCEDRDAGHSTLQSSPQRSTRTVIATSTPASPTTAQTFPSEGSSVSAKRPTRTSSLSTPASVSSGSGDGESDGSSNNTGDPANPPTSSRGVMSRTNVPSVTSGSLSAPPTQNRSLNPALPSSSSLLGTGSTDLGWPMQTRNPVSGHSSNILTISLSITLGTLFLVLVTAVGVSYIRRRRHSLRQTQDRDCPVTTGTHAENDFRGDNVSRNPRKDSPTSALFNRHDRHPATVAGRTSSKEGATLPRRPSNVSSNRSSDQTRSDDSTGNPLAAASNATAVFGCPSSEHTLSPQGRTRVADVPPVPQEPPNHCKRADSPAPETSTEDARAERTPSTFDGTLAVLTRHGGSELQPVPYTERSQVRLVPVTVFMDMTQAGDEDTSEPPPYQPRPRDLLP
ncbi:hypothetical protein C8Q78DRAFT_410808 [Trametes maxima]|nr:hypothetical protein C8Q78DRAFT_410808 [Trametes maxima]